MISILDALDDPGLFGEAFVELSWRPWRALLATLFGLPVPEGLVALVASCTGRSASGPFREAWLIVGRRAGKSRILALVAVYLAAFVNWRPRLSPGEVGVIMVLAADRNQAGVLLGYVRGLIGSNPMLAQLATGESVERIELGTLRVAIEVHTSSYRAVRGRTVIAALCDEVAFWRSETSANPAEETVRALRPSLATLAPHSLLIGASSPYSRQGLLWQQHRKHYGREGSRVLVWQASSLTMNPALDPAMIADALEDDPEGAAAEWLAEFRSDIARFVDPVVIEKAVSPGRLALPRAAGFRYHAFLDPSGGSADSFTLAVAHREGDRVVLDHLSEVRPPFSPETVASDFAVILKGYGCARAVADRYAGVWVAEVFGRHGVTVEQCARPKSDLYGDLLPALNSGRVDLLDHQRLVAQLGSLERRTARSGRDSIDHGPGGHDDIANAAAGALGLALARPVTKLRSQDFILGAPLQSTSMLPRCPDWRTAFPECDHADW